MDVNVVQTVIVVVISVGFGLGLGVVTTRWRTKQALEGDLAVRVAGVDAKVEAARRELETARREATVAKDTAADLQQQLVAEKSRSQKLEEGVAAARRLAETVRSQPVSVEPDLVADRGFDLESAVAEVAERTAGGQDLMEDDLTKIRGIGQALDRSLKKLGIVSYRQIASFTRQDAVLVAAQLGGASNRIERDNWMAGAAGAHADKYAETIETVYQPE